MKTVTIKINTENSAFAGDPGHEVKRILREICDNWDNAVYFKNILDINGNTIGRIVVK